MATKTLPDNPQATQQRRRERRALAHTQGDAKQIVTSSIEVATKKAVIPTKLQKIAATNIVEGSDSHAAGTDPGANVKKGSGFKN